MNFGYRDSEWLAAKEEGTRILSEYAARGVPISYSDFVSRLSTISLEPQNPVLAHLLGEISTAESLAGRGMLSVLVVHKNGDKRPGQGFFELARTLGHSSKDDDLIWIAEWNRVIDAWRSS